MSKLHVFALVDNVANDIITLCVEPNVCTLIRGYYPSIAKSRPLKDVDIYEVGDVSDNDCLLIDYKKPIQHEWNEYRFPETRAEAIAPLGASPSVVEQTFNEIVEDLKDK